MGNLIIYTEEEKQIFSEALLQELEKGENRNLPLSRKLGVSTYIIRMLKDRLITER